MNLFLGWTDGECREEERGGKGGGGYYVENGHKTNPNLKESPDRV